MRQLRLRNTKESILRAAVIQVNGAAAGRPGEVASFSPDVITWDINAECGFPLLTLILNPHISMRSTSAFMEFPLIFLSVNPPVCLGSGGGGKGDHYPGCLVGSAAVVGSWPLLVSSALWGSVPRPPGFSSAKTHLKTC